MENAEEVMQLLEEFSKIKPKEIPRELEDYLGYVAKTGDPVYQWSLVKTLFREKLIGVITDFYESTLTVELPPCPNVEPFNYDRVKTSLLERFDTFSSAPFTVQRICELLTSPRKEYNRADKYMRAIEKNILVVSTREPGTGTKRPYDCDGQSETILNGMPDVKINEADGSLLHVPTDLPYLGAPPASNDVTVETSEPNSSEVNLEKEGLTLNQDMQLTCERKELPEQEDGEQSWSAQESEPPLDPSQKSGLCNIRSETDISIGTEENDCDTSNRESLVSGENSKQNVGLESENRPEHSSDSLPSSPKNMESSLPDSIDSSDSISNKCSGVSVPRPTTTKLENEELESGSDENVVSSTPADDIAVIQEEIDDPTDSEAEATDTHSDFAQEAVPGVSSLQDNEIMADSRIIHTDSTKSTVTISEITAPPMPNCNEIDLECNEISGTVESPVGSPVSPENDLSLQTDAVLKENNSLDAEAEVEQCLHPDSSNDVTDENKITSEVLSKEEQCSEADSMSDSELVLQQTKTKGDSVEEDPDQTIPENDKQVLSPNLELGLDENSSEVCTSKTEEDDTLAASKSPENSSESEESSRDELVNPKLTEVQSSTKAVVVCDEERKSVGPVALPSTPSSTPDSQKQELGIEEINVDPSCEVEEEAMDVDDSSNQMMVSEGENEGEPMDQSEQQS